MSNKLLHRYSFSLVELLIVISILSILASLFQPSINRTLASARDIKCKNNLKQIYIGMDGYLNDYSNFFPVNYASPKMYYWNHSLVYNGYLSGFPNPMTGVPILCFACPDAYPGSETEFGVDKKATDYGKNSQTGGGVDADPVSILIADNPSATYLVGDTGGSIWGKPPELNHDWYRPHIRHNNRWNCLFFDGRVEQLDDYPTRPDEIGWAIQNGKPWP